LAISNRRAGAARHHPVFVNWVKYSPFTTPTVEAAAVHVRLRLDHILEAVADNSKIHPKSQSRKKKTLSDKQTAL